MLGGQGKEGVLLTLPQIIQQKVGDYVKLGDVIATMYADDTAFLSLHQGFSALCSDNEEYPKAEYCNGQVGYF